MEQTIKIDKDVYEALKKIFGKNTLNKKINEIFLTAVKSRLEEFNKKILEFEEKYGMSFKDFAKLWDEDKIKNKYRYEVESDFIDWEILEMEKRDLIMLLSRLKNSPNNVQN